MNPETMIELAEIFAEPAVHLQSPAKSFAKRVPYHLGDVLEPGEVEAVIQAARERVGVLRADAERSSARDLRPLLTLEEVAPLLRLTAGVMEKLLIDWQFRRDCGWPHWVRGRWLFHPDAFGPEKPEYFSRLPTREPYPPPPHCDPQPTPDDSSS